MRDDMLAGSSNSRNAGTAEYIILEASGVATFEDRFSFIHASSVIGCV